MNFYGIFIGIVIFVLIGLGYMLVIKTEFYFGKKVSPVFLVIGFAALVSSLFAKMNDFLLKTLDKLFCVTILFLVPVFFLAHLK
jgi:hypothetical protein